MTIDDEISPIFKKIGFVNRFKDLVERYGGDDYFETYSNSEVDSIIQSLGYDGKYYKKEDFFKIFVSNDVVKTQFHVSFRNGTVEFIIDLVNFDKNIDTGGTYNFLYKKLTGTRIRLPVFSSYEDLREILKEGILICEDIQIEISRLS